MTWQVRVMLPPDRSGYRFPPYWWPDTPLPGFEAAGPTTPTQESEREGADA